MDFSPEHNIVLFFAVNNYFSTPLDVHTHHSTRSMDVSCQTSEALAVAVTNHEYNAHEILMVSFYINVLIWCQKVISYHCTYTQCKYHFTQLLNSYLYRGECLGTMMWTVLLYYFLD